MDQRCDLDCGIAHSERRSARPSILTEAAPNTPTVLTAGGCSSRQLRQNSQMAQRTIIALVDDLDGTELGPGVGETIRFGIDGRSYEIDLRDDNAAALREALQPFIDSGRRIAATGSRRRHR